MSADAHVTPLIEIFFSYSHEDEKLRKALDEHLSEVWRRGVARCWHDRQIGAGTEWEGQIDEHLGSAQIILLLISKSFLASDYCYDIEMKRALERHERGEAVVIPVLLRPIAWWKRSPFRKLQCLPREEKPVTDWENQDAALASVAEEITKVVDRLLGEAEPSEVWPRLAVRRLNRSMFRWGIAALLLLGLIALGAFFPWRHTSTGTGVTSSHRELTGTSGATGSRFAASNFPPSVHVRGPAGHQEVRRPSHLAGIVIDPNGNGVGGATVTVEGVSVNTSSQGHFDLTLPRNLVRDEMTLRVTADGYQPTTLKVTPNGVQMSVGLQR